MSKKEKIEQLTKELNVYRDEYYNSSAPSVSDAVYDRKFDELKALEEEENYSLPNSPTSTVGYAVVSELERTSHPVPLLSLDKTKSVQDLISFAGKDNRPMLLMLKFDGLTMKLIYENGQLIEASTRGDGHEGDIVTHNARHITGVPQTIEYRGRLVVTGEAYITKNDFEELKETITDSQGNTYKHPRNLASGSVRLLDASVFKNRKVRFAPFNVLEGFDDVLSKEDANLRSEKLKRLHGQGGKIGEGFWVNSNYPFYMGGMNAETIQNLIDDLTKYADERNIPIDGMVFSHDDIAYGNSLGKTGHHYKSGMAFKFEDELFETVLRDIEWTPGRTGQIAPVAVFDAVEIDGCEVKRASLHNLSFIKKLELKIGNRILVCKRNMIIPHIEENLDRGEYKQDIIPTTCPVCGSQTMVNENSVGKGEVIETLYCMNEGCGMRKIKKFVHFVSKKAMDIDGLSEATLTKFIEKGWLTTPVDIYSLNQHESEIVCMDGFGEKSYQRLWKAINDSKQTSFERFVISMDISMVGKNASAELARVFDSDLSKFEEAIQSGYDFTQLTDFGATLNDNIHDWFNNMDNVALWNELRSLVSIKEAEVKPAAKTDSVFTGKTVVVTGKVEPYSREGINEVILSLGAKVGSSVSKNTDYLVCGEKAGSKLAKAQSLGVTVLTPAEFDEMSQK